jgi:putative hemolysin
MHNAVTMLFRQKLPAPLETILERLLVIDRFKDLYEQVRTISDEGCFLERFLETMKVRPRVSASDLLLVPKEGPVVAVANHPFGLIEGAIVGSLFATVRPKVKIMANHLLATLPEARRYCIFVNPFGGGNAVRANQSGLRDSIAWLKQGGLLGVFPAGEVPHLNLRERAVTDPEWNRNIARLIRLTDATVLHRESRQSGQGTTLSRRLGSGLLSSASNLFVAEPGHPVSSPLRGRGGRAKQRQRATGRRDLTTRARSNPPGN